MEGGTLPWKVQRFLPPPDLDSYGKPLPSPPSGYFWELMPDNSWELRSIHDPNRRQGDYLHSTEGSSDIDNELTIKVPAVVEHVVLPEDTLQGICLRYRISAMELRRHNMFSGSNIQVKSILRIPIDHSKGAPVYLQDQSDREVLLQRFKNATGEGSLEAKVYLEDCEWQYERAYEAWRADDSWEELPVRGGDDCGRENENNNSTTTTIDTDNYYYNNRTNNHRGTGTGAARHPLRSVTIDAENEFQDYDDDEEEDEDEEDCLNDEHPCFREVVPAALAIPPPPPPPGSAAAAGGNGVSYFNPPLMLPSLVTPSFVYVPHPASGLYSPSTSNSSVVSVGNGSGGGGSGGEEVGWEMLGRGTADSAQPPPIAS